MVFTGLNYRPTAFISCYITDISFFVSSILLVYYSVIFRSIGLYAIVSLQTEPSAIKVKDLSVSMT
jgi:hypothetical protein